MSKNGRSIGLALGGGAVHGVAHIGVLEALEKNNLAPDFIAGTSIGSLIGGLYAFGVSVEALKEIAISLDWYDLSELSLSKMGLLSNRKLGALINDHLGEVDIADSRIPLRIIATDISTGDKVVFREGSLDLAVMASSCIPGIFIPIEIEGKLLVDGGLVENVPVSPLREEGMDHIIAVDITSLRLYEQPDDIIEIVVNSFDIAMENLAPPSAEIIDLLIQPKLSYYNKTDTDSVEEMIEIGFKTAMETLGNGNL